MKGKRRMWRREEVIAVQEKTRMTEDAALFFPASPFDPTDKIRWMMQEERRS